MIEVKKAQTLVQSRYRLNPISLKLVTTLISLVQKGDTPEQEYCIKCIDFKKLAKMNGNGYHDLIKEACYEIMKKPIEIGTKGKKDYIVCNWASSCEYVEMEGLIKFQISPKLLPYVVELKENYLKYELKNILSLKSDYTIRIYEWLKDESNTKKRYGKHISTLDVPLEELRKRLELPESYKFQHIKTQILDKARTDIAKYCDIEFNWEVGDKIGKGVSSIKFQIAPNEQNTKQTIQLPQYIQGFMSYVGYLRELYKGSGTYFFIFNYDLGVGKNKYYFGITYTFFT